MVLYLQSDHASVGLKASKSFSGLFVKTPTDKEIKISKRGCFRTEPICQRCFFFFYVKDIVVMSTVLLCTVVFLI
jgi:hypothetical protein